VAGNLPKPLNETTVHDLLSAQLPN
jgi:hypothetical protein